MDDLREEYAGKELPMPVELCNPQKQRKKRVRFTIDTQPKHHSILSHLKRERKTIFFCLLAVIIFTVLAIWSRLRTGDSTRQNQQYARLHALKMEASFTPLHLQEVEKAKERAKRAERLAERAVEREGELAKEIDALKELLKKHGMEPETVKEKEKKKSFLGKLASLFQREPEREYEREMEHQKEYQNAYQKEHDKSIQEALERIADLEAESNFMKKHAVTVEEQFKKIDKEFDTVAANMRHLDATLAADFASIDTDLQIMDCALVGSLDRHQEERDKINEVIDHMRVLGEYAEWHTGQIDKIGVLEQSLGTVAETTQEHATLLDQHDQLLQEHSTEIANIQVALEGHTEKISKLNKDLAEKTAELHRSIASQSAQHKDLAKIVTLIRGDLHALHKAVTADLQRLKGRLEKVQKMAKKPMRALDGYKEALESVNETVVSMQHDMASGVRRSESESEPEQQRVHEAPSHEHEAPEANRKVESNENGEEFNQQEWAKRYLKLNERIQFLEESRIRAKQQMALALEATEMRKSVQRQMRRDTYDIEAGQRRVKKILKEVEEIKQKQREDDGEAIRDRILAPAKRIIAELEEKYKDVPIIGAWFERQR